MTPEEFRRWGHRTVDWVADYLERVESLPVMSTVRPGEIRARLPAAPPALPEPFDAILADLDAVVMPGITHWQSPNFFGFFPSNNSGPSILGELVSAGLGVQGMLWATSPACTELETHVLDWVAEMLGLPPQFRSGGAGGGVIQESASSAALCAVVAARERVTGGRVNREGGDGTLTAYISTQTHSSVEKAIRLAGIGDANLRRIDVDGDYAMRADRLAAALAADRQAGRTPFFVCATVGTTSSTAIDPVPAIGAVAREYGAWLHVDAALAGTAAICPEFQPLLQGVELADSFCFNPHKWMFTNFDCDCFFVADRVPLISSMTVLPEYLKNQATASGAVIDYRDWQVSLGRRFRALKLWFVIRGFGVEGLRAKVRDHVAWAAEFAAWVDADPRFERVAPAPLNLVCFRLRGSDEANERLLARLNASGRLFLSHTKLDGRYALRFCVGQTTTERRHVEAAWRWIVETAADTQTA